MSKLMESGSGPLADHLTMMTLSRFSMVCQSVVALRVVEWWIDDTLGGSKMGASTNMHIYVGELAVE